VAMINGCWCLNKVSGEVITLRWASVISHALQLISNVPISIFNEHARQ